MGGPSPGPRAINFHGSASADQKQINAKDLGLSVGDMVYLRRIRLEGTATKPDIVSVAIGNVGKDASGLQLGGRSRNVLCSAYTKFVLDFSNPNPRLFEDIDSLDDVLATIFMTDTTSTLTFAGTIWVDYQGEASHLVK